MQGIKKKMRMELHLERLQFTGSERLPILISLSLLPSHTFKVLVSVSSDDDCEVEKRFVSKSGSNKLKPGMNRAPSGTVQQVVIGCGRYQNYPRVKQDKGHRSKAPQQHISKTISRKIKILFNQVENRWRPQNEHKGVNSRVDQHVDKRRPKILSVERFILQAHQQRNPIPKRSRYQVGASGSKEAGRLHAAILIHEKEHRDVGSTKNADFTISTTTLRSRRHGRESFFAAFWGDDGVEAKLLYRRVQ